MTEAGLEEDWTWETGEGTIEASGTDLTEGATSTSLTAATTSTWSVTATAVGGSFGMAEGPSSPS